MRKDFDELPDPKPPRMPADELARILDFVDSLEEETEASLGLKGGNRELRILSQLMRDHIGGRLTTQSSLIAASGVAYGTALRTLQDLAERGYIMKRPRTKTGKTFSLHPSDRLIEHWREYSRRVKAITGGAFGLKSQRRVIDDYYFGASYMCAGVIPRPTALADGIGIPAIRILVHADPTFLAMTAVKALLANLMNTTIRNKALSIDRLHEEILSNAGSARSKYDIVTCNAPWFGDFAERGVLTPLDEFLADDPIDLSDFYPSAVQAARCDGVQYGLPIQTAPELLVYRQDLFDEAGLAPPHDVDQVLDAAKYFHKNSRSISGISWNAAKGTPLGHSFIMMMAAFGQPVINLRVIEDGYACGQIAGEECRPMLGSAEARMTADYMLELLQYSPSNILSMSWYERAKAYAQGQCAMSYCYSLMASIFENDAKSPAYRNSVYLPHPSGAEAAPVAPLGGYALAIPANVPDERKPAVWRALKLLVSAEANKQYVLNGSTSVARFSVAGDAELADLCPLIGRVDQLVRLGRVQHWPRLPIPEMPEIISIVGQELHPMLLGDVDPAQALSTAQKRIDALMRLRGRY